MVWNRAIILECEPENDRVRVIFANLGFALLSISLSSSAMNVSSCFLYYARFGFGSASCVLEQIVACSERRVTWGLVAMRCVALA